MSTSQTPKSTPQAGNLTNPPNLVGKRVTPEEFSGRYIVRAAAQKVVNVPKSLLNEAIAEKVEFRITVTPNTGNDGIDSGKSNAPPISVTFSPRHVTKAASGQHEISIAASAAASKSASTTPQQQSLAPQQQQNSDAASTWIIHAKDRNQCIGKTTMRVTLTESVGGRESRVLMDQTTPIILQKVLDRKILVFLYGSPIGRIGITISVSPDDGEGFKARMSRFLAQFSGGANANPQVASTILEKCDEITTFAYLWSRYKIVDYTARLRRFLKLYSRHMVGQEEQLLGKYKMHEEDLFMNLVLDNGPEELDIDPRKRLEAFKSRYFVTAIDVEKEAARRFPDYVSYLDSLSEQHGPEPDPRTYLFPEPVYTPPPSLLQAANAAAPAAGAVNANAAGSAATAAGSPTAAQIQNMTPSQREREARAAAAAAAAQQQEQQDSPRANRSATVPPQFGNSSSSVSGSPKFLNGAGSPTATTSSSAIGNNNNNSNNVVSGDLWTSFISSLGSKRVSSSDIFFLSDDAFLSLMVQVNVNPAHRHLVLAEWRRRGAENLQLTHFVPTDPSFDAVRTELLALTGMQPINLSVLGVVGLRNIEHETTHSARLSLMENKSVERCIYAGEYNLLLRCAERGITAAMTASDAGVCFPRRPFSSMEKPTAISVMVCDVIVGFQTNANTAKEAALAKSDTVAIGASTSPDASLFVRDVRHVLPRFIVHCHVDPTLVPCPLHPNKQVEYYVVDAQVFACSNCVVLGPHVGKPIVTLDEALQWARTQLNELLRDAETVYSAASEVDRDMTEHFQSVTGEAAQKRKQELIETIRREAELRAQDAAKQLEAEMAMQADVITTQQSRLAPLRAQLSMTTKTLQSTIRQGNPQRALEVLQALSTSYDGNEVRGRMNEVKQSLAQMPNLSSSRLPWQMASNGQINHSQFHNQQQQQQQMHYSQPNHQNHGRSASESSDPGFSRFMEAASTIAVQRQQRERTPPSSSLNLGGGDQQLFNKFTNSARGGGGNSPVNNMSNLMSARRSGSANVDTASVASSSAMKDNGSKSATGGAASSQAGRELLQDGWKAFRKGDVGAARALWSSAGERYGNTAVGARANAYIAEALDKDAPKAAEWYERALHFDPTDCMTLFNYGVLLEATGHTFRALQLFESAQRLGDVASGKRARAIRQQQLASSDH